MVKRINSFLKQGEADSTEDKVTEAEQIVELIKHSSTQTSKQSNVQIDEITVENGNAMGKHVGITATENYEKNDGAKVPTPRANVIPLDDEVSKLKFKLIQHVARIFNKNKWTYIDNSNVDYTCLNRRGLHLNKKGSATLSKNYSN